MKIGKYAQSTQYLICVNHQEYRDASVMKPGIIFKIKDDFIF